MIKNFDTFICLPEGVTASVESDVVILNGPKGSTSKFLKHPRVLIEAKEGKISISNIIKKPSATDKMYINTMKAHIKNLIGGVQKGYTATVKILSGHFPITAKLNGRELVIKNFFGEKVARKVILMDGANVKIQGDLIIVEGLNKEVVGQIVATIEGMTRITNRDRRRFQDGCYIIQKPRLKDG